MGNHQSKQIQAHHPSGKRARPALIMSRSIHGSKEHLTDEPESYVVELHPARRQPRPFIKSQKQMRPRVRFSELPDMESSTFASYTSSTSSPESLSVEEVPSVWRAESSSSQWMRHEWPSCDLKLPPGIYYSKTNGIIHGVSILKENKEYGAGLAANQYRIRSPFLKGDRVADVREVNTGIADLDAREWADKAVQQIPSLSNGFLIPSSHTT